MAPASLTRRHAPRQRGAGLVGCLAGLSLGLLVLQAMLELVTCAQQVLLARVQLLRLQEAQDIAQTVLQAVAQASRGQPGTPSADAPDEPLRVLPGAAGGVLRARFVADGAPGACGETALAPDGTHTYRLDIDPSGTLRCAVDGHVAQPLADGLGAWELEFVESRGSAQAPRLRNCAASQVRDWNRIVLMRACLRAQRARPGTAQSAPACAWVTLAPPAGAAA